MDRLKTESVDWAITHIRRYGDTDIFPVPFEYEAIKHSWPNLRDAISKLDIASYEARPFRRMLVPKATQGYRVAIQLDPVDTIIYTALAYEAAESVERSRIPLDKRVACSYRVQLGASGELFRGNNGWDDFHSKSQELSETGSYTAVVTADIADFYNQIGHHRVRNGLEIAGIGKTRAENIENLLMNFTRGQSQGIPIVPSASAIFAEACLSDVDNFLLRKGYTHTRYVDDFRIFCIDEDQAQRALHDLTEYLYTTHRLTLQSHKTSFYDVSEFVDRELVDPEEIETQSREQKLKQLQEIFSGYNNNEEESEPDIDEIVRDNLGELFQACLDQDPIHLGTAKYLLRRATTLRTGLLREIVLDNLTKLIPVMREATLYIRATTSETYSESICDRFLAQCQQSPYEFLPYVHSWLIELLLSKGLSSKENEIVQLSETYRQSLGIRPYALVAREKRYHDWVREQKEVWNNNSPWDRRAIIWAAKALSNDELNYWLKRVQNAGDLLDKAIAESVLNTENRS